MMLAMSAADLTDWFTTDWSDDVPPFPFTEDENANIHGYGHQDKAEFAAEVNRYDAVCNGEPWPEGDQWTAGYIGHRWAVMDPDGELFRVVVDGEPVTAETPNAFPITTLWGQR